MRNREYLVGTITQGLENTPGFEGEILLVEFMGEGANFVVYAIAPLEAPSQRKVVLKYMKNLKMFPFLEMETLHYKFRVHEALYPKHPLRMTEQERLHRLTAEMLEKIDSSRLTFRISLYYTYLASTLAGLMEEYEEEFYLGTLDDDFLKILNHPSLIATKGFIDENLLYYIGELIDEDRIAEEHHSFLEHLAIAIQETIESWQFSNEYSPFSKNPVYNLLGLYLEDFINTRELFHVSQDASFIARIKPRQLDEFSSFIANLYYNSEDFINDTRFQTWFAATMKACELLEHVANQPMCYNRHLSGVAKFWKARTLSLGKETNEKVRCAYESALLDLTEPESLVYRHDALLDLAHFYVLHDFKQTIDILEVQDIEKQLNITSGKFSRLIYRDTNFR